MNQTRNRVGSRETGENILPFLVRPLPLAMSDVRPQVVDLPQITTLIYADEAGCSIRLAVGLALLGRSSKVIRTPLDAIVALQDGRIAVDAVFAPLQDDESNTSALFDFVKDEYPRVRRIAFARHDPRQASFTSAPLCQHDMILWDPWDRTDFVEILKDALNCRSSYPRSSWTDLRLFESLQGADMLAVAEIVKRYRYRIVRLVLDATHETMDREDVVQNVYLAIVRALPFFGRVCSPGEWIDRITRKSIRAFLQRKIRETSAMRRASLNEWPGGRLR